MSNENELSHHFEIKGGDFSNAGRTSTSIKEILQEIGIDSSIVVRAAIASYEAEMNVVMYAHRGVLILNITPEKLHLKLEDEGPGIENVCERWDLAQAWDFPILKKMLINSRFPQSRAKERQ